MNEATQRQHISPAEMDALMRRWDELELQCKKFTAHDDETAESRKEYEKKVKKCLEENRVN